VREERKGRGGWLGRVASRDAEMAGRRAAGAGGEPRRPPLGNLASSLTIPFASRASSEPTSALATTRSPARTSSSPLQGSGPTGASSAMHTHAPGAAERGRGDRVDESNRLRGDHQGRLGDPVVAGGIVRPERVGTITLAECDRRAPRPLPHSRARMWAPCSARLRSPGQGVTGPCRRGVLHRQPPSRTWIS
jgi:hypothetical protein